MEKCCAKSVYMIMQNSPLWHPKIWLRGTELCVYIHTADRNCSIQSIHVLLLVIHLEKGCPIVLLCEFGLIVQFEDTVVLRFSLRVK